MNRVTSTLRWEAMSGRSRRARLSFPSALPQHSISKPDYTPERKKSNSRKGGQHQMACFQIDDVRADEQGTSAQQ
jgi:hypothetical protein